MQVFKKETNRKEILILKDMPIALTVNQGSPGVSHFDGEISRVGCLGCLNPRCMFFSDDEIECSEVVDFSKDKSIDVCPVEAIRWDETTSAPRIDSKKCVNCGVCVSRCPVGAIYFTGSRRTVVNTRQDHHVEYSDVDAKTIDLHFAQISQLIKNPRNGTMLNASENDFSDIYRKLLHIRNNNCQNSLVRSLLIALGCKCSIRRIGDVYTRMDAIYSSAAGSFGAIEVEFGRDTLDASRGILDDIAILNTRYGIEKHKNRALVICLQLPNARQGYWQVVRDVKNVEGIKIQTITIGALLFLLWGGYKFEPEADRYYIDYDGMSLRNIISNQANRHEIPLGYGELGIFEPMK